MEFKIILELFQGYLRQYPRMALVSYSRAYFDQNTLVKAGERYGVDIKSQLKDRVIIDYGIELWKSGFKAPSYKLKHLGIAMGYIRINQSSLINGKDVSREYSHRRRTNSFDADFIDNSLKYNFDDCRLVLYLSQQLDIFDYNSLIYYQYQKHDAIRWLKENVLWISFKGNKIVVSTLRKYLGATLLRALSLGGPIPDVKINGSLVTLTWSSFGARMLSDSFGKNDKVNTNKWYSSETSKTGQKIILKLS